MTTSRREILLSAGALAGASVLPLKAQLTPQRAAVAGAALDAVTVSDFESIAREIVSAATWAYMSGGAADENTLRWNRDSLDRLRLQPRTMVDVSKIDTRIQLFGREIPFPILLAPTGSHRAVHPEGELATVKGAGNGRAVMTVSTMATTAVEEIAKAATQPLWFQLYVFSDRSFTRDLVERAQSAGCQALCVTVDTPRVGSRDRQMKANFSLPPGVDRPHLKGLKNSAQDPSLSWKDMDWFRSFVRVPLLLKGVLSAHDADHAVQEGVSGIIVSNHGGRQLDTAPAAIDALPGIVEKVGGRVPVLMDGGIRRGTDVVKALALGATAVLIGRSFVYGLAAAGAEGVTKVINILRAELGVAMALTGRPSIASIDGSVLWPT